MVTEREERTMTTRNHDRRRDSTRQARDAKLERLATMAEAVGLSLSQFAVPALLQTIDTLLDAEDATYAIRDASRELARRRRAPRARRIRRRTI
jgi:protein-disulfide isomerase-like protein with CxxC motif